MREILFRGFDEENKCWRIGWYTRLVEGARKFDAIVCDEDGTLTRYYIHDVSTVGQFTGLFDKNGKKIFEGDVLRYGDEEEHEDCAVYIYNGCFMVGEAGSRLTIAGTNLFDCIVIGNIHDNQELLGGK